MNKVVLASSSDARKLLLLKLIPEFETLSPDCDESPLLSESPRDLSLRLAKLKSAEIAKIRPEHIIIGSDQTATFDDKRCIGKPLTNENAITQLQAASGQTMHFYTSLCVINSQTNQTQCVTDKTTVIFRHLTNDQITSYIRKEDVRFCAGGFKVEAAGISLFEQVQSTDPTGLIGLPLISLTRFLLNEGIDTLS